MKDTCLGYVKNGLNWKMCKNGAKVDGLCRTHFHAAKRASVRNLAKGGAR